MCRESISDTCPQNNGSRSLHWLWIQVVQRQRLVNCVVEGHAATAASERIVQIWSSVWSLDNTATILGTLFDWNYRGHCEVFLKYKRALDILRDGAYHPLRSAVLCRHALFGTGEPLP